MFNIIFHVHNTNPSREYLDFSSPLTKFADPWLTMLGSKSKSSQIKFINPMEGYDQDGYPLKPPPYKMNNNKKRGNICTIVCSISLLFLVTILFVLYGNLEAEIRGISQESGNEIQRFKLLISKLYESEEKSQEKITELEKMNSQLKEATLVGRASSTRTVHTTFETHAPLLDVPVRITTFETHVKTVCEHESIDIKCAKNKVIEIQGHLYGRQTGSICANHPIAIPHGGCSSSSSMNMARMICDGKQSCKLIASNRVFGDPCVNTFKYMTVKWKCVNAKATLVGRVSSTRTDHTTFETPAYELRLTPRKGTFDEVREMCRQMGGDLVQKTLLANTPGREKLEGPPVTPALKFLFIGITDQEVEGNWKFLNGENFIETNSIFHWNRDSNEPNGGRRENCAIAVQYDPSGSLYPNSRLNDYPCNGQYYGVLYGICEIKI